MRRENNPHQYQHNTDNKSASIEQFKPDRKTICSRLAYGIPLQLALAVPDEMEITAFGPSVDGSPIYVISEILVYGTAEDIIEYVIDNALFPASDLDVEIKKVGAGINGSLYILRQYFYSGTAESILDYFGW